MVNDLVYSATIGIGKYNGGGMLQTPDAVADDGLFDLTVIRRMNPLQVLYNFKGPVQRPHLPPALDEPQPGA